MITVNLEQFDRVTDKIVRMAGGSVEGATIAVWGLTFKANTDDLRDSPALEIVKRLLAKGARVQAYDPTVTEPPRGVEAIEVCGDAYAACEGATVLAVLTEWDEFKWLDLDKTAGLMTGLGVVDCRNLLDRSALVQRGFDYEGIGRA